LADRIGWRARGHCFLPVINADLLRPGGTVRILFNPAIQNPKVIAVVQTLEPLPVLQRAPYIVFAGWSVTLVGHALLFNHISVLRPQSYWKRL
jgi:hypothetical protein